MLVKGSELIPLFHHCYDVETDERGAIPSRCTPRQKAFYRDIPYGAHMLGKALSCAGVTLECVTDAQTMKLRWMIDAGYPASMEDRKSTLDLYADGELLCQQKVVCPHGEWQENRFELPAGKKHICLVLPQTYQFILNELTVPEGSVLLPVPRRKRRLLFLCDSIGQGIGASCASTGYTVQTMLRLGEFDVLNQSVGGLRYDAPSIDRGVPEPELILVQIGTNDWQRREDRADFDRAMQGYLHYLTESFPGVPVVLLTPMKRCDGQKDRPEMYREDEMYEMMRGHCSAYPNVHCYNGWTLMPRTGAFFADGVHPNDAGHLWLAENVCALIRKHLPQNG